jgi:hypothetical protein
MAQYLKALGLLLCTLGVVASVWCTIGVFGDEDYYGALKALEKYPNNVLYTTELKIAEPRHMLLTAGAFASAPIGFILGSICIGIGAVLRRLDRPA